MSTWREPPLDGLVRRAIDEFGMIVPGDRVVIGASGGKDSTALAWALSRARHAMKGCFEIRAVHIRTDLGVNAPLPELRAMLAGWGIELEEVFVPVKGRLKPGRTMNCWWCSTQRRVDLIDWAMANGFNKLALGHHLDDILETLFMNMMQKGKLSTMPVVMPYRKFPLTIIRPLALVEERRIIDWVKVQNLGSVTCTCPFGINSRRRQVRERIAVLTQDYPGAKIRMLRSLANQKPAYLPGCPEHGKTVGLDDDSENGLSGHVPAGE